MRHSIHYLFILFCISIWLSQNSVESIAQSKPDTPKPSVSITLERQSIRENDAIVAHIWISNEGPQTLTSMRLHIASPAFLKWYSDSGHQVVGALDIGPIQPNEVIRFDLLVRTDSKIGVGDFNNQFTFEYTWQTEKASGRSLVIIEKPLKASLFGSDSIAGVPLALAAYIVPGLFFWLVVARFKLPWGIEGVALGDKLIYSVLASIVIVLVWNGLRFPDVSSGISLRELGIYAVTGGVLGLFLGGGDWLRRYIKKQMEEAEQKRKEAEERQAEARLVKAGDSDNVLLEKLLERYPDRRQPRVRVELPDGQEFIGSMAIQERDVTVVIGWFKIDLEKVPDERKPELQGLYDERNLLELLRRSHQIGVEPEAIDPIKDGNNEDLGYQSRAWVGEGHSNIRFEDGTAPREPLILE